MVEYLAPFFDSEVCHPRCAFKLYGELDSAARRIMMRSQHHHMVKAYYIKLF